MFFRGWMTQCLLEDVSQDFIHLQDQYLQNQLVKKV